MDFSDHSLRDCEIVKVNKFTAEQSIEFKISFPENWEENIFVDKILKFAEVTFYKIKTIPFEKNPTILKIIDLGITFRKYGDGKFKRNKIKIETNAGNRFIEFEKCELL